MTILFKVWWITHSASMECVSISTILAFDNLILINILLCFFIACTANVKIFIEMYPY